MTGSRQIQPSTNPLALHLGHGHRQRHFAHGIHLAHHPAHARDLLNDDGEILLLLVTVLRPIGIMIATIGARALPRHHTEVVPVEDDVETVVYHRCLHRLGAEVAREA